MTFLTWTQLGGVPKPWGGRGGTMNKECSIIWTTITAFTLVGRAVSWGPWLFHSVVQSVPVKILHLQQRAPWTGFAIMNLVRSGKGFRGLAWASQTSGGSPRASSYHWAPTQERWPKVLNVVVLLWAELGQTPHPRQTSASAKEHGLDSRTACTMTPPSPLWAVWPWPNGPNLSEPKYLGHSM